MSASVVPTVKLKNGVYSVAIGEQTTIRWWFETTPEGVACAVKIDSPALKEWCELDEGRDELRFPVSQ
jgi:hypothetical protein